MSKSLLLAFEMACDFGDPNNFFLAIPTSPCVKLLLEACYSRGFSWRVNITWGCDEELDNFFNHDQAICHNLGIFSSFKDSIITIETKYI